MRRARLAECRASITLQCFCRQDPGDGEGAEGQAWRVQAEQLVGSTGAAGYQALLAQVPPMTPSPALAVMSGQEA